MTARLADQCLQPIFCMGYKSLHPLTLLSFVHVMAAFGCSVECLLHLFCYGSLGLLGLLNVTVPWQDSRRREAISA
eukprot:2704642-Pleurochrysis_carterae.AAC.1